MISEIRETGDWVVDYGYQDACKLTPDGMFEYRSNRVNPEENTLISFQFLPHRLQTWLKLRWPNMEF